MSTSPTSPARPTAKQTARWLVEVVRGRDIGRTFALDLGETVVGNALNGQRGLDLVEQEGSSPRRMAARHAAFACAGQDLSIEDLESPGGTFVNQQRLLSKQPRKLSPGDVIQLGGVQLKVKQETAAVALAAAPAAAVATKAPVSAAAVSAPAPRAPETPKRGAQQPSPPPPPRPSQPVSGGPIASAQAPPQATGPTGPLPGGRLPTAFTMAGGGQCRTWDDFLILSAQSWAQLRDELVSGRLVDYLRRIRRPDLIPHAAADRSPDDRLDDWLARIPATQSSAPELDVHPTSLVVQATMGGGVTRLSLRITNVGFRLLRSSLRLEPADAPWVKLLAGQDGRPFPTIDQTEIPVDVELPEKIDRISRAVIVIESTGGTRRVEVRVERPADPLLSAEPGAGAAVFEIPILARELRGRLQKVGLLARVAVCCGAAIGFRLLAAGANALPLGGAGKSFAEPRISSLAIITVAIGVVAGLLLAKRRGDARDLFTTGMAGGMLGLLSAAPWYSLLQSGERLLGSWSTSLVAVCFFWAVLAAVVALVSTILIPYRAELRQVGP